MIITIPIFVANTLLVLQAWRVFGYLRTLAPLILANAAGTVLGGLLLAGLDQKMFAVLITAMVVLLLARGDRIVGAPGRAARGSSRRSPGSSAASCKGRPRSRAP